MLKGEKRPADTVVLAVMVTRFATGKVTEELTEPSGRGKSGKAWGKARAKALTAEERSVIVGRTVTARWSWIRR